MKLLITLLLWNRFCFESFDCWMWLVTCVAILSIPLRKKSMGRDDRKERNGRNLMT